ncbi:MAG: hypothetical protein WAV98_00905 [Minisyncoccia bacterium]
MYIYPVDNSDPVFYQGDIIDNFPFFVVESENFNVLEPETNQSTNQKYQIKKIKSLPKEQTTDHLIVIDARRQRVMILSQTCDVQQRETIIFAPVFEVSKAISDGRMTNNQAISLRNRKLDYWFYLPKQDSVIEESYIDLQIIHYVPKSLILENLQNRVLALSDWGRHHLSWALSDFFGRPIKSK